MVITYIARELTCFYNILFGHMAPVLTEIVSESLRYTCNRTISSWIYSLLERDYKYLGSRAKTTKPNSFPVLSEASIDTV